jgi:hypothetical protein
MEMLMADVTPVSPTDEFVLKTYRDAVDIAKAEYDSLLPELSKLQMRANQLKRFICSGSELVGERADDRYQFMPPGVVAGRPTPRMR